MMTGRWLALTLLLVAATAAAQDRFAGATIKTFYASLDL